MPAKASKPQLKVTPSIKSKANDAVYKDKSKPDSVRQSNIAAAKAVADAIRTSLGPRGMDKMIEESKGDVSITNDGATILKKMNVLHPTAKMLVELSKSQDIEAGDGTTSVVVLAGSFLMAAGKLLDKGIHAGQISESFQFCASRACEILESISKPVDLFDRESLIKIASTSLNSKVVSQYSSVLAPLAVDAVLKVVDKENPNLISLNDIRIVKKLGGTVEDTQRVNDMLLHQKAEAKCGIHRVVNAKIALIQFCISPPKTDMDNSVVVQEYDQMDRVIKEERQYILNIVKAIKQSECNVLLIQKSILRDSVSDLALHFLSKIKVMTVKDIERDEIEFICRTLGCKPIASIDHFKVENFGFAGHVEELQTGTSKCVKISEIKNPGNTVSLLLRGSNKLVLDEADRSLHDALCVVRCLVKKGARITGGGAPEVELSQRLLQESSSLVGIDQYCMRAFAEALEVIPFTLAENAGLNPIKTVTELRNIHAKGNIDAGINVRKGTVTNMLDENVMQPLLVSLSAISLAAETVRQILKIDDIVNVR